MGLWRQPPSWVFCSRAAERELGCLSVWGHRSHPITGLPAGPHLNLTASRRLRHYHTAGQGFHRQLLEGHGHSTWRFRPWTRRPAYSAAYSVCQGRCPRQGIPAGMGAKPPRGLIRCAGSAQDGAEVGQEQKGSLCFPSYMCKLGSPGSSDFLCQMQVLT